MNLKLSGSELIQTVILCIITFLVIFYISTETDLDKNNNPKTPLRTRILTSLLTAAIFSICMAYLSKFVDDQYTKRGKLKSKG